MPQGPRQGWGGSRPSRERPPWWPANEAWPPRRGWRGPPRRFLWRFAAIFFAFIALVGVLAGLVASIVANAFGPGRDGPYFFFPLPLLLLIGFVLVIGAVASGSALRRIAAPLAEVMGAAEQVAADDYATRVRPRGPRDVRALGRAFNTMAERLERTDAERRRLLADVTHELRTPLAVIQAELEALLDGVRQRDDARIAALLDETRVLTRLVEDLRTLSLAEAGALELHRESTDVGSLIEDIVASFIPRAAVAKVDLAAIAPTGRVTLDVDPVRVREVLANLLDNAVRHTPPGGRVDVSMDRVGAALRVAVRDTGSGISAEALPHVFERFAKGQRSRGSGLGLAIARDLVEAHGGTIGATSDGPDRGTTVRFTLPAPPG